MVALESDGIFGVISDSQVSTRRRALAVGGTHIAVSHLSRMAALIPPAAESLKRRSLRWRLLASSFALSAP
jgi:hypothetical protein